MTAPARRRLVAVIYAEATTPVVRSQTPPLLAAVRELGHEADAAVFTSPRARIFPGAHAAHSRALQAIAAATGRRPIRRTHLPGDRGLDGLGRSLARALRRRGATDAVLLCRQPRAALIGIAARRKAPDLRVVLDLRGIRDEEYLATLGRDESLLTPEQRARLETYRRQEAEACRGADAVLCVSAPMARLVRSRHELPEERVGRVPNSAEPVPDAETLREAARRELGVAPGELLLAYSGTMAAWQMPEASALLAAALQRAHPAARLLFLTPDLAPARAAAQAAAVERPIFRSARPGEAARLLCAADYGLLLRTDSAVNRVACPVKFGEYLACGVRPILTPRIGDQSEACTREDLGVVVSLGDAGPVTTRLLLDLARPGAVDAAGRARRRAWALGSIAPLPIATRLLEFLDAAVPRAR